MHDFCNTSQDQKPSDERHRSSTGIENCAQSSNSNKDQDNAELLHPSPVAPRAFKTERRHISRPYSIVVRYSRRTCSLNSIFIKPAEQGGQNCERSGCSPSNDPS